MNIKHKKKSNEKRLSSLQHSSHGKHQKYDYLNVEKIEIKNTDRELMEHINYENNSKYYNFSKRFFPNHNAFS